MPVDRDSVLTNLLVSKGIINAAQLAQARLVQTQANADIGDLIADLGFATETQVAMCRSDAYKIPYLDFTRTVIDTKLLQRVEKQYLFKYTAIPVERRRDGKIVIAVANPAVATPVIIKFETTVGAQVVLAVSPRKMIYDRLVKLFGAPVTTKPLGAPPSR